MPGIAVGDRDQVALDGDGCVGRCGGQGRCGSLGDSGRIGGRGCLGPGWRGKDRAGNAHHSRCAEFFHDAIPLRVDSDRGPDIAKDGQQQGMGVVHPDLDPITRTAGVVH